MSQSIDSYRSLLSPESSKTISEYFDSYRNYEVDKLARSYDLKKMVKESLEYSYIFENDFYNTNRKEGDRYIPIVNYIVPAVFKVLNDFFLEENRFNSMQSGGNRMISPGYIKDNRQRLFNLHFNMKEFLENLDNKIRKNVSTLDDFSHIDPISVLIDIIIDDYVGSKYLLVSSSRDIDRDITRRENLKELDV